MYIRFLQFRSSLLPESFLLSFPHPTKIFQFGWFRLPFGIHALLACGFAHSDSSGSLLTYSSPKRFAVRRVLLRLLVPRHPLCALSSLTFLILIRLFLSNFQRSLFTAINKMVELSGIEPLTSCVQNRRSPSWAITPYLNYNNGTSGRSRTGTPLRGMGF